LPTAASRANAGLASAPTCRFACFFKHKKHKRGADDCLTSEALDQMRTKLAGQTLTDDIADIVSGAVGLGQRIRSKNIYIEDAQKRLEFVISTATQAKPQLILTRDELLRVQLDVFKKSGIITSWLATISSGSTTLMTVSALIGSLLVWVFIAFTIRILITLNVTTLTFFGFTVGAQGSFVRDISSMIFFMNGEALAVITSAAIIGGVVSILSRLGQFSQMRGLDPIAVFLTVLLKPLIGVTLSIFILAALAGQVVGFGFLPQDPLGLGTTAAPSAAPGAATATTTVAVATTLAVKTKYILWVIGFLSGFSERFAWDFVQRTEGIASGNVGGDSKSK
jgi:hypothetical protein